MLRKIVGFDQDEHMDWRAWLDCYHPQHVRHQPPFFNRPWVVSEETRAEKLGMELDCVRCDAFEFPNNLVAYKKTPLFSQTTIPKGLLRDHSTKTGTWGLIQVVSGALEYKVADRQLTLTMNNPGVVVPNMLHSVVAQGPVSFYVEFFHQERNK